MAVVTMSHKELGRLEALIDLDAGRTTARRAATLLGLGERQVFRRECLDVWSRGVVVR